MFKKIRNVYDWAGQKVHSKYSSYWFFGIFLVEAVLFLPVDPLLVLFCTQKRERAFFYAFLATTASVLGGIFGYLVGWLAWDTVGVLFVKYIITQATFDKVIIQYRLYQNWLVLIGAFVPMPYKAITLSAGFCQLPMLPFIICSILGRGARFYLVAGAIRIWGNQISRIIDRYFNHLIILFVCFLLLVVWVIKR